MEIGMDKLLVYVIIGLVIVTMVMSVGFVLNKLHESKQFNDKNNE